MSVTCPPGNTLPDFVNLSVPHNVPVVVIPGSNASDAAMVACCAPRPVAVADSCYEWCQVDKDTDAGVFSTCLVGHGHSINASNIVGFSSAGEAGPSPVTVLRLGVWTLLVLGARLL